MPKIKHRNTYNYSLAKEHDIEISLFSFLTLKKIGNKPINVEAPAIDVKINAYLILFIIDYMFLYLFYYNISYI